MSEREQRIRWLRGQIEAMLRQGDDVECLPLAEELERLEAGKDATANGDSANPRVLNAPARIWLVYGDNEWDVDHADLDPEDVCWSHQREFPADVEYVNVAEVARLTADLAVARDEVANTRVRYENAEHLAATLRRALDKTQADLAAARAHLRTLQGALNTLDVHATARHPELIDIPADEWVAAFDGIDEARDYDPTLDALPTPPKEDTP